MAPEQERLLLLILESLDCRIGALESDWEGRGSDPSTGRMIKELADSLKLLRRQ